MDEPDPPKYDAEGRRVRAALAYSRRERKKFAAASGMRWRTLDRVTAGGRAPTLPELRRIAHASGVPLLFLTHGWSLYEALERIQDGDSEAALQYVRQIFRSIRADQKRPAPPHRGDEDRREEAG